MDINEIRKVELHCHVDGLLNPALLKKIPPDNVIHSLIPDPEAISPVNNLTDWIERYGPAASAVYKHDGEVLLPVFAQYLCELKQQNVRYSEIMLSGFTFQHENILEQIALYEQFRRIADQIGGNELQVEFLLAFGRTTDGRKMERLAERILSLTQAGLICGVAVAGLETENTIKPHRDLFARFHEAGLGIEIHAGEWSGPEFIWEALEYGHASRIGHGLSTFDDPLLVSHINSNNIHLEFCPTSNRILTRYKNLATHPIKRALDENISFSINTDDPGPFATDMNHEYSIVQKAFSLTEADFDQILYAGLKAAFGQSKITQGSFSR